MVDHVLHPGEVGVALRRRAVAPAHVVGQPLAAPVRDVERRVGKDVAFRPQIGMAVVAWKLSPWAIWPSMPRIARFIFASRHVV